MVDAYDGYALANGIKKQSKLSDNDVLELRKSLDEDAARAARKKRIIHG